MDREVRRGVLPVTILAVLARGRSYGYDLTQTLAAESNGVFALKEGTLYPILYRFEEAGWVVPEWDVPERGLPRKYYRLTDEGRAELASKLDEWHRVVAAIDGIVKGVQV